MQVVLPHVFFLLGITVHAATASAQAVAPRHRRSFDGFSPASIIQQFRAKHGSGWRVSWDGQRGVPEFIWGKAIPLGVDVSSDAALEQASRGIINELAGALGFYADTLILTGINRMNLSEIGSSDKIAVLFRQEVYGIPVHRGTLSVLFSAEGSFLAMDNRGLPHVVEVDATPERSQFDAADVSMAAFLRDTGLRAAVAEPAELPMVFFLEEPEGGIDDPGHAEIAYVFTVGTHASGLQIPVFRAYAISARGPARVLGSWSLVHQFQSSSPQAGVRQRGGWCLVRGRGTSGLLPDGNHIDYPLAHYDLADVRVDVPNRPTVYSNTDGIVSFPGIIMGNARATLDGLRSSVVNWGGPNASVVIGNRATFEFNSVFGSETQTAEVNAHRSVMRFFGWIKEIDPYDHVMDVAVVSNVNLPFDPGLGCNAYYDGSSLNFFAKPPLGSGFPCPNTAYSTIVWHEEGHYANDRYGSGNGSEGFDEGAADVWANYIADSPIVGARMFGPETYGRTGLNTRRFCGDDAIDCYGEEHADGEVLMGALWKVHERLLSVTGQNAVADELMLRWFQTFDDAEITSVVREHWLVLDDSDGDIANGTPHSSEIDCGFMAHGFYSADWEQKEKLTAGDASAGDLFGVASAFGNTALLGAAWDDPAGPQSGSAYVFVQNGTTWSQQAKLTASDGSANDFFGIVSLWGDTALVGAALDDGIGPDSGSAYVFVRNGSAWSQQTKLTASDASSGDFFGRTSVFQDTALVGAVGANAPLANQAGAAYVFVRSGTNWSEEAKLTAGDAETLDEFGQAASVWGDTAVVGAYAADNASGVECGAAYVFVRSGTNWSQQAKLTPSDGVAGDHFGWAVSMSGDTVVVGADQDDGNSGAAYVFVRNGTTWSQQAKLAAGDRGTGDRFGYNVSILGDLIAAGAQFNDDAGSDSGSVYVFHRNGTSWQQERKLTADDGLAGDRFGGGVAISENTVIVGANFVDGAGVDSGAAYVYQYEEVSLDSFLAYPTYQSSPRTNGGTAGTDGLEPTLWACGEPTPGSTVYFHVYGGLGGISGDLFFGSSRASVPFLGGTKLVGNVTQLVPLVLDARGHATHGVTYPNDPGLIGSQINVQWWGVDLEGPMGWSASNGIEFIMQ